MKILNLVLAFLLLSVSMLVNAQKEIKFIAEDGLEVNGDLYLKNDTLPFIILCHQANYSRGEYSEIAKQLMNLNYNCVALDLRYGNKVNYVTNKTAANAKQSGLSQHPVDAKKDIEAALNYLYRTYSKSVILLGSSYSASLVLFLAEHNYKVKAAIAFSPGEYFLPEQPLGETLGKIDVPVFVSGSKLETPFLKTFANNIPSEKLTLFLPEKFDGAHGAKALWKTQPGNEKYWFELLIFFKSLQAL